MNSKLLSSVFAIISNCNNLTSSKASTPNMKLTFHSCNIFNMFPTFEKHQNERLNCQSIVDYKPNAVNVIDTDRINGQHECGGPKGLLYDSFVLNNLKSFNKSNILAD